MERDFTAPQVMLSIWALNSLILMAGVSLVVGQQNQTSHKLPVKESKLDAFHALTKEYLKHASIFKTTVDFTVPLFSFYLPKKEDPSDQTAIIRQNLLGQFLYFAVVIVSFLGAIALPSVLNKGKPVESRGKSSYDPQDFSTKEFTMKDCFMRSMCEAINEPHRYGLLAQPLMLLFMAADTREKFHYHTTAHTDATRATYCRDQFNCPFNGLGVLHYITQLYQARL